MPFPPPADAIPDPDDTELVVRPYAVTAGRTRPASGRFDLASMVMALRPSAARETGRSPEQAAILTMSKRPVSVAELAAHLSLPPAVVRVVLGDLLDADLISVTEPYQAGNRDLHNTLEAIRDGLRAL